MKKSAIIICILCTTIVFADKWHNRSDYYWNKGQTYKRQKDYKRAVNSFLNAARAEKKSNNLRISEYIKQIQEVSGLYMKMDDYERSRKYYLAMSRIAKRYRRPFYQGVALLGAAESSILLNNNKEAVKFLKEALVHFKRTRSLDRQIVAYNRLGRAYREDGNFKPSLSAYKNALAKAENLGLKRNKAAVLANIGILYFYMKDYSNSLRYQNRALDIDKKHGTKSDLSIDLSNISQIYLQLGRFGEAVNYLEQSLSIERNLKNREKIAARYNSLGEIYFRLGQNDKALRYFEQSLEINRLLKLKKNQAALLHKLGVIYEQKLDKNRALDYYIRALSLDKSLKKKESIKKSMSDIGTIYERRGRYDEALNAFGESKKNNEFSKQRIIASDLINIGRMYVSLKKYSEALKPLRDAEIKARTYKLRSIEVDSLYFQGIVHYYKFKYIKSVINLQRAESLVLQKKNTNLNDLYRLHDIQSWLLISQYGNKSPGSMIVTANRMMQYKLNYGLNKEVKDVSLPEIQRLLKEDESYIIYPIMCSDLPVVIVVQKEKIYIRKLEVNEFLTNLGKTTASKIYKHRLKIDESSKVNFRRSKRPKGVFYDLQDVINYYRSLHMKKNITQVDIKEISNLGNKLYNLLIQPVEIFMQGKNRLIIRPDCILSTLPFGSLRKSDGRYLEEIYRINLSVSSGQFIRGKYIDYKGYNAILIGNPVHKKVKYLMTFEKSNRYMDMMTEKACMVISGGKNMNGIFNLCSSVKPDKIVYSSKELSYVSDIMKGSTLIQGQNASEDYLKSISRNGSLRRFNIIYLSVNGIIVPEVPELSSLLFSRGFKINKNNDGYLNILELSKLKMNSRVFWISYMDLPEGRINMRNGVGKVVQAIHRGGSQGVVVPLWKIDDKFRAFFSAAVYDAAKEYSISYDRALTLIKRIIITSDYSLDRKNIVKKHLKGLGIDSLNRYKNPYYWSAYQFYGR